MTPVGTSLLGGVLYGLSFMPPLPNLLGGVSFLFRISFATIGFAQWIRSQRQCGSPQSAFASGFSFGFSFICISLFGIYNAFLVVKQLLFFPPGLAFLGALWGSLLGGFAAFLRLILNHIKSPSLNGFCKKNLVFPSFSIGLSCVWLLFEITRGCIGPLAFPWNLTAHLFCFENIWINQLITPIVQPFGIYIVSWIFAFILSAYINKESKETRIASTTMFGGIILFGVGSTVSDVSHENNFDIFDVSKNVSRENKKLGQKKIRLLLIQPNITQQDKLRSDRAAKNLQKIETLTCNALSEMKHTPNIIVWPETAINSLIIKNSPLLERLKNRLPDKKTLLIFGADRLSSERGTYPIIWHNSLFILSQKKVEAVYDKVQLLPFGEYVPLRRFFPEFFNKVLGGIDCMPGNHSGLIQINNLPPFETKICSETMFRLKSPFFKKEHFFSKGVSRENFSKSIVNRKNVSRENFGHLHARFILSIANDGWFATPILWQHLAVDRLRAIEAHLPLVRTTNTGITAYIAPNGSVKTYIPSDVEGSLEVVLRFKKEIG